MFVLVEYNKFYNENIKEIEKYNYTPITLFKLNLSNKNQIKEDLNKIKELKQEINPNISAIEVTVQKLENSTVGTINHLKHEFDILIGLGGLNKINRFLIESTQIDFLCDPHNSLFKPKIDFIHHFNSGLNHILCKTAKERQINFFFKLNFFENSKKIIPKEIGRINQNIKFANKYKIPTLINFLIQHPRQVKFKVELNSIMSFFNISTQQKKESLELLQKVIKQNRNEKSKYHIADGINFV